MTIQQLKNVHAKIMALIIESDSDSATVSFRTFGKNIDGEQEFLLDFFDKSWYDWNNGNPQSLYSFNSKKEGDAYVTLVKSFLGRPK